MSTTELLIQPDAGIEPLLAAIDQAKETIQIMIFRFDRPEIEAALKRAAKRGVFVHALVAHVCVGQGGEKTLRKLEMRLLADGLTVARTSNDMLRYHDKIMIVDRKLLFLLAFNYTFIDIARSRSFGIMTDNPEWVAEAEKLFIADALRQPYTPGCDTFVVSPENSRRRLMALLGSAKKQILIYDDKLSDPDAMRLLSVKAQGDVDVRVIGAAGKRAVGVQVAPLFMRLHAQIILCDGERMFLGSQSLRSLELDSRREVGVLIDDASIIQQVVTRFEADWTRIHEAHSLGRASQPDVELRLVGADGVEAAKSAAAILAEEHRVATVGRSRPMRALGYTPAMYSRPVASPRKLRTQGGGQ